MLRSLLEKINPKHTAVLVIDVQNHFCHPDGASAQKGANVAPLTETVPRISALIDVAREAGATVIFVQLIHSESTTSDARLEQWVRRGSMRGVDDLHCRAGTWNADFYEVGPEPGEVVVVKHRYSAFIGTDLDLILRSKGIRTLVLTGFSTHACVESTARDAFMMDYYVVVAGDGTSASDADRHRTTLANIDDLFGEVRSTQEIEDVWKVTPVAAIPERAAAAR